MSRRERVVLGGVLAVALVLRLAWCVYAARPPVQLHDPTFYRLLGEQLASGNGYRLPIGGEHVVTAYYPPGYALSLWPLFWLLPDGIETGIIAALNIAWQLAATVLAFFVARDLTGRSAAGFVAAGALALWPNLIFHTASALTESLFVALLMVALLLAVRAPWSTGAWETRRLVAVGAVLGAATLVRPITIALFPLLGVVFLVARAGWRRSIVQTAVVTAAAIAIVSPWVVRNAIVMDQATLSTNTGDNLCMSRRVGGSGGFELPNERCFSGPFEELDRPAFETARDAHGRERAWDFVREHPDEELRLVLRRLGHTFGGDADGLAAVESYGDDVWMTRGTRDLLRRVATTYGALAGLAGVVGLVILGRRRAPAPLIVVVTTIAVLIPPLVFFGDPRFHVPAVPLAAVGFGCASAALLERQREIVASS